ncbi:hypothetical protein [Pseudomonas sp. WS 5414]|uniref:helix-turn-helix transcriptional regulator n=1 Tax=Pseudomonas sp. WS 5414 TaxID=2717478 RepID=UPI0021CCB02B|nr:hypothetical protein [Pseudomonas sp. WS 5414]
MNKIYFQPRILRANQAPSYLGMCRAEFNKTVRPYVREFPIGQHGVGFDRVELDQWADDYIAVNAIEKESNVASSPTPNSIPPPKRKKCGPVANGSTRSLTSHTPPTAEDFYKLVAEIKGKPTTANRGRKKR